MTPERWQQIDQLFHAALAREPGARPQFLLTQCADDPALRVEVESLLSSHEQADSFIETSAGDVAAELLQTHQFAFEPGQKIENYRIVGQLGSGGMGEVYLAEDVTLKRKVALKLLPPHFTVNPDRVRRFEREARAASALNHPNIITIYEIKRSGSNHFIATEFVDGKTLRQLMNEKPLRLSEILNVAIQVADALSGAHAAGIVHRDIKPENIMIRHDGYMKILDFGLAKLTEQQTIDADLETPTLLQSNPGLVMGTVQYMSPEQARSKNVGIGTDIWSLGIVMYELLAGQVPFTGETPSHVMVSLMEDKLPPLKDSANVPEELDRFVAKTLQKNQRERYQSAGELARDLKSLKQRLQHDSRLKEWLKSVPSRKEAAQLPPLTPSATRSGAHRIPLGMRGDAETAALQSHPTSSAEYLVAEVKRHKRGAVIAAVVAVGALSTIAYLLSAAWKGGGADRNLMGALSTFARGTGAAPVLTYEQLTLNGGTREAAISPDGQYIAYAREENRRQTLWLRRLATSENFQLIPPAALDYGHLLFSRDGTHVFYVANETDSLKAIYRISTLGGAPARVLSGLKDSYSLSPDESRVAFPRSNMGTGEETLVVANIDGTGERELIRRGRPERIDFPAWSPDGRTIVCVAGQSETSAPSMSIVEVDVASGAEKVFLKPDWFYIGRVSWLPDGGSLLVRAVPRLSVTGSQLWLVSYPDGRARRLTEDLNNYLTFGLSADASRIVATQIKRSAYIWVASDERESGARQLAEGEDFAWTGDGRIVYTSEAGGNHDIWIMSADGSEKRQLTVSPGFDDAPVVSPDGRYVVFISDRTGTHHLWRMNIDGGNQTQLTDGFSEKYPTISPDGRWVFYNVVDRQSLWKVPIEGGAPFRVTDDYALRPSISPDGRYVAYFQLSPETNERAVAVRALGGSPTVRTFRPPPSWWGSGSLRWDADSEAVIYARQNEGQVKLYRQALDGSPPQQIAAFGAEDEFSFSWSPDRTRFAFARGDWQHDAVLIRVAR